MATATAQRKLYAVGTNEAQNNKRSTPRKKSKPRPKEASRPKGPIYTALVEFFGSHKIALPMLYVMACVKGALFPAGAFFTMHYTVWLLSIACAAKAAVIVFCLGFSLPTALQFGKVSFDGIKGQGFAYGLELLMLVSMPMLSWSAYIVITFINVLSAFYNLRTGKQFTNIVEV